MLTCSRRVPVRHHTRASASPPSPSRSASGPFYRSVIPAPLSSSPSCASSTPETGPISTPETQSCFLLVFVVGDVTAVVVIVQETNPPLPLGVLVFFHFHAAFG